MEIPIIFWERISSGTFILCITLSAYLGVKGVSLYILSFRRK